MRTPRPPIAKWTVTLLALVGTVAAAFLLALRFGDQPVSLTEAWSNPSSTDATILWSLRLPRVFLAGLVGAALSASGCALQGLTRNPLADPFVLGVSGGAALGATLALAFGLGAPLAGASIFWLSAPSAFAFLGALGATALVWLPGRASGDSNPTRALLAGVVFNAFAAALITCIKALSAPDQVGDILHWLAGAVGYEAAATLAGAAALQCVALGALWALAPRLNLLALGDDEAASLGVPVDRTRLWILLASSLSVAGAVALSGLVGFVGLIVPHALRRLLGPDPRLLLPCSALGGAAFLMVSDLGARLLFQALHAEPPVGVVTALVGGPAFLWLLHRGGSAKSATP